MIQISRFIDKIAVTEGKNSKDFVMPMIEARSLRDELAKVLAEYYSLKQEKKTPEESTITVEIKGGTFK